MNKKFNMKKFLSENSAVVAFVLLFVIAVCLKNTTFLNIRNLTNILLNNSIIGIVALGMTLIIITGGIDLSVGSQLAATGLFTITVFNQTGSIVLGIAAGIAMGMVMGLATGALVAKCSIPAFIVTLGTMSIYRSVAQYFFKGGGILAQGDKVDAFVAISNTRLFGAIPLPILYWLILAVIIGVFSIRVATGRRIYAIGSNEKAAKLSGINVDRVKIATYMISGALVAAASVVEASRLGSMNSASSGTSYEMDAIAAVVIGGTSMSGGKGKIIGTVFGTLTLGIIDNMMNMLGVPTFLVSAIKGAIIIIAVLFQRLLDTEKK